MDESEGGGISGSWAPLRVGHVTQIMSQVMSHVTWVMGRYFGFTITPLSESCLLYEWVVSHMWIRHVILIIESAPLGRIHTCVCMCLCVCLCLCVCVCVCWCVCVCVCATLSYRCGGVSPCDWDTSAHCKILQHTATRCNYWLDMICSQRWDTGYENVRLWLWLVYFNTHWPLTEEIRLKILYLQIYPISMQMFWVTGTPFTHLKTCLNLGTPVKTRLICMGTLVKTCWKFWQL